MRGVADKLETSNAAPGCTGCRGGHTTSAVAETAEVSRQHVAHPFATNPENPIQKDVLEDVSELRELRAELIFGRERFANLEGRLSWSCVNGVCVQACYGMLLVRCIVGSTSVGELSPPSHHRPVQQWRFFLPSSPVLAVPEHQGQRDVAKARGVSFAGEKYSMVFLSCLGEVFLEGAECSWSATVHDRPELVFHFTSGMLSSYYVSR